MVGAEAWLAKWGAAMGPAGMVSYTVLDCFKQTLLSIFYCLSIDGGGLTNGGSYHGINSFGAAGGGAYGGFKSSGGYATDTIRKPTR